MQSAIPLSLELMIPTSSLPTSEFSLDPLPSPILVLSKTSSLLMFPVSEPPPLATHKPLLSFGKPTGSKPNTMLTSLTTQLDFLIPLDVSIEDLTSEMLLLPQQTALETLLILDSSNAEIPEMVDPLQTSLFPELTIPGFNSDMEEALELQMLLISCITILENFWELLQLPLPEPLLLEEKLRHLMLHL